jgi:hypothetical protein
MAVVSVAITLSFHVKNKPSHLELRMAKPLGAVFWALSVLMLILGLGNYIRESLSFGSRLYLCRVVRSSLWRLKMGCLCRNSEQVQSKGCDCPNRVEDTARKHHRPCKLGALLS